MPTTRPRHLITETDALAAALDAAATRWPDLSRAQLVLRLALIGYDATREERDDRLKARVAAIKAYSGALSDSYGPGYLTELRQGWPE